MNIEKYERFSKVAINSRSQRGREVVAHLRGDAHVLGDREADRVVDLDPGPRTVRRGARHEQAGQRPQGETPARGTPPRSTSPSHR